MTQLSKERSSEEVVLYGTEGGIATITLNRPHRANAWTGRLETAFRDSIARAETDDGVRVMVITGAGKFFCAGADSRALEMSSEAGEYQTGITAPLASPGNPEDPAAATRLGFLRSLSKPVIAAVNGPAAGIGFVLVCCADIRFVAVDAKLTVSAPRLGLPAECGLSWLLPRLIGGSRATEILLSSRIVDGTEAAAIGLAHQAVAASDVLAVATEYARTLVRECAPSSLSATKQQLALDMERSFLESDQDSDRRLRVMMGSEEFREGVAALRERRAPRFMPLSAPGTEG
jgi:enoyl-CoA hydratase/carnithine racemase